MRTIYFAQFLIFFLISTNGESQKISDLQSLNLNGKVKSITEFSHSPDTLLDMENRTTKFTTQKSNFYHFNTVGNLTTSEYYNFNGELLISTSFFYDTQNNKIKEEIYNSEYDENLRTDNTFDKNQKELSSLVYNSNDKLIWIKKIKYRKKGRKITEKNFNDEKKLISKRITLLNSQMKMIKQINKNSDQNYSSITTMDYININEKEYKHYDYKNKIVNHSISKFDDKGNIIELIEYDPGGNIDSQRIFIYEFDQFENWIRKTQLLNNNVEFIFERKITYY